MKNDITVRDFYNVLHGTEYENNYGLILNALAHNEHTLSIKLRETGDKIDIKMADKYRYVGDKIFDFLNSKGFYDVD